MKSLKFTTTDPKSVTVTISGNATADGDLSLFLWGVESAYTPGVADTPAVSSAAWVAQMATDFAGLPITITDDVGAVTITSSYDIFVDLASSADSTQSVSLSAYTKDTAVIYQQTAAGTGLPALGPRAGVALIRNADAVEGAVVHIQAQLLNSSGAAKEAKFHLWTFDPILGWTKDPAGTNLLISAAAADTMVYARLPIAARCSRVAIELAGDSAGANLANCLFSAWLCQ